MNAKIFAARLLVAGSVMLASGSSLCQGQASGTAASADSINYSIVQRGPYSRVWHRTVVQTDPFGIVTTNIQSYTELGTSICYLSNLTNGEYLDSVEEVDPVPGGAQAVQGRHRVFWTLNANTPGGVVVNTPDSKQLSSTLWGLAYYDIATGSNAAIAWLKDCNGTIVAPNQVMYTDAFNNTNFTADLCYTYTKAGLSQSVLVGSLPAPDSYGLSDETTLFQIYTEFFLTPQPEMTAVTNGGVVDNPVLDFGDLKMGTGEALFLNGQDAPVAVGAATKQWIQASNRTFLVESVPYSAISSVLPAMPHTSNVKPGRASIRRLALLESPPSRPGPVVKAATAMKRAKAETTGRRLAADYVLLSSSTNLVLQSDETFFVTSAVNITGTLTVEGGTVVKYTNSAGAEITATNIVCQTAPYSPAVFTSMNDNAVGTVISNSTGVPRQVAATYLNYGTLAQALVLRYLRCSYASQAISGTIDSTANSITMWDSQFINTGTALKATFSGSSVHGAPLYIYNVLFSECTNAVNANNSENNYFQISAVNVTADHVGSFLPADSGGSAVNSLFTAATNTGVSLSYCYTNASSNGIYQTVGAGSYYLAAGSPYRNAGTSSINSTVLADLQTLTTYPPVVVAGWFTNDYTFFPQAQRDTDTPDLGYHYFPLDYAINIAVSNATVTVLPGTALAGYGTQYGLWLYTNAIMNCQGTATSPNYLVRYNTVQEQSNTNWESTNWEALFVTPAQADMVSSANFAFTDWSVLEQNGQIYGVGGGCPLAVQNCQFYGGVMSVHGPVLSLTNCLFHRPNFSVTDISSGNIPLSFYNNLFFVGELSVAHSESGICTVRDNFFDQTTVTLVLARGGKPIDVCSNNAYVTTNYGVLTPENNDKILTNSPAFQVGALGQYYYPTNLTNLIHTGSQSAASAGLYHYTVTTNNAIEGTNIVSIGFHYVAVGTNGLPLDYNGDGIPDYLEDANGNGLVDSGEIDWLVAGDLGLTATITRPANNSTIP